MCTEFSHSSLFWILHYILLLPYLSSVPCCTSKHSASQPSCSLHPFAFSAQKIRRYPAISDIFPELPLLFIIFIYWYHSQEHFSCLRRIVKIPMPEYRFKHQILKATLNIIPIYHTKFWRYHTFSSTIKRHNSLYIHPYFQKKQGFLPTFFLNLPTTIDLWLVSLTASKELSIFQIPFHIWNI